MPCVVPRSTDLSPLFLPILAELFQQAEHHIAYKTRIARCRININDTWLFDNDRNSRIKTSPVQFRSASNPKIKKVCFL